MKKIEEVNVSGGCDLNPLSLVLQDLNLSLRAYINALSETTLERKRPKIIESRRYR